MSFQRLFSQESHRLWPVVIALLIVVLAPTVCVLWFMNAAVENERLAVRQRLQEVYGRELTLCQNRLAEHCKQVGEALEASRELPPAEAFAELAARGVVESVLVFREGRQAYPKLETQVEYSPISAAEHEARELEQTGRFEEAAEEYAVLAMDDDVNVRARALLGQARSMLHTNVATAVPSGSTRPDVVTAVPSRSSDEVGQRLGTTAATSANRFDAIEILTTALQEPELATAKDAAGRLIAPNALLLAIELLPPDDLTRPERVRRLADRLRHYDGAEMSSPQRLFMMQRLHDLAGENFSTMAAERLALQAAAAIAPTNHSDQPTTVHRADLLPGLWTIADSSGQTIGVWTKAGLTASLEQSLERDAPAGASFAIRDASQHSAEPTPFLAAPAGSSMPDWTLALSLDGPDPFAAAAQRHEAAYLWMACLAIGTIGALAVGLGFYLRQQMLLTRLKNDLIATVSHELKTPLSSMRVLTDTLLDGRIPSADDQRDYLQLISRENLRLSRLIDNFLTFSRMERHKAAFEFRPQRVKVLVDAALEALGDRAAVVMVSVPPQLVVQGDADALVTLLVNLLDNAWKYSGDKKEIDLSAEQVSDDAVEIRIRDNGIGIARRHQRRIFQRFYQVDRQLSRQTGGCGLGLAIVQFIAKAHHAEVGVVSQPGNGSTFCVRLPAGTDRAADVKTAWASRNSRNEENTLTQ
jgi:signal transduction histidine kinase